MDLHHLNCGAMQPYGGALFDGRTRGIGPANLTCHCLLLETSVGLVLVDTGTVGRDAVATADRLSPFFRIADRVRLVPAEAAFNQIQRLGLAPADVAHIVMTHLDFDHVAGLPDFPGAKVHVSATEAAAARHPTTPKERARYRPAAGLNQAGWKLYDAFVAEFFGLQATYLEGIPGLMLVSLPGHTKGHCGVAIDLGRGQWLLHAGDAILNGRELDASPFTPAAARLYQWVMQTSQVRRRRTLAELRRIRRDEGDHVEIICTHDPAQLAASRPEHTTVRQRSPGTGG
jgi:glyoxylase-like metal-dependent hydrolase (beta-lactamase superfamily II)